MKKSLLTYASLLIIILFIAYMIFDSVKPAEKSAGNTTSLLNDTILQDAWGVPAEIKVKEKKLNAVAAGSEGKIYAGGDSFVICYKDESGEVVWKFNAPSPVSALSVSGDSVFASTSDQILVISEGKLINEWGPYESNSIITSVSAGKTRLAFCDAGNKKVYIIDKGGAVVSMAGQNDPEFVLPSAYFDVAINEDNSFWAANPGHRRIEKRTNEGLLESYFGEAGLAPGAFCGCCNPSHFTLFPGGFVTAEKGINRIKILDSKGEFVEFVSSENTFERSIPLDVATADGMAIYAANPADSKIYVFKRK